MNVESEIQSAAHRKEILLNTLRYNEEDSFINYIIEESVISEPKRLDLTRRGVNCVEMPDFVKKDKYLFPKLIF